jgi:hypothetical protein
MGNRKRNPVSNAIRHHGRGKQVAPARTPEFWMFQTPFGITACESSNHPESYYGRI